MTELVQPRVKRVDMDGLRAQWQAEQRDAVGRLRRVALAVMLSESRDGSAHPPSESYTRAIESRGGRVGVEVGAHRQPQAETLEAMRKLVVARAVDGMIVQQPQPDPEGPNPLDELAPELDVDASLAGSAFVRPTTQGVLRIRRQYPEDINLGKGANVVVAGSGGRVGASVSAALERQGAHVTPIDFWQHGHTKTDLRDAIDEADALVTAYGREPGMIEPDWLHGGMTVVDMSYEAVTRPDGKREFWGDVHPGILESEQNITWIGPRDVGSAATSALIDNTIFAAQQVRQAA